MSEKEIEVVDIIDSDEEDDDDHIRPGNKEPDGSHESICVSIKTEHEEVDVVPVYDVDDNKVLEMPTLKVEQTEGKAIEKNVEETKNDSFASDPGRLVKDENAIKKEILAIGPRGEGSVDELADLIIIESDEEMEEQTEELHQVCEEMEEQTEDLHQVCEEAIRKNGDESKGQVVKEEEEDKEDKEGQEKQHATQREQQQKTSEETERKKLWEKERRAQREREEREQEEHALKEQKKQREREEREQALREQKEQLLEEQRDKELKEQRERGERENNQREKGIKEQRKLKFGMKNLRQEFSTQERDEQLKQLLGGNCLKKLKRRKEPDTSQLQLKQQKEREMSEKLEKQMSEIRHQLKKKPEEEPKEQQELSGGERGPRISDRARSLELKERVKKGNQGDQSAKEHNSPKEVDKKQQKALMEQQSKSVKVQQPGGLKENREERRCDSMSQNNKPQKQASKVPNKLVRCLLCESFFTSVAHLQNHMASVHGPRSKPKASQAESVNLKADAGSGAVVDLRTALAKSSNQYGVINIEDNSTSEVSVQALSKKALSNKRKLKENRSYNSPRSLLQCRTCSEVFSSLHHLRQHRTMKHRAETSATDVIILSDNQREFSHSLKKCRYCPYTTSRRALLYRHVKHLHMGARESVCKICGKDMNGSLALKIHYQTEHADKLTERCPYCPYKSRFKGHIKLHINASHRNIIDGIGDISKSNLSAENSERQPASGCETSAMEKNASISNLTEK